MTVTTNDPLLSQTLAIIERVTGPNRTPPGSGHDTQLSSGFWLDSVELVEVLVACEAEFGIVFDGNSDLASAFDTLGTLTDLIRRKRSTTRHEQ